MKTLWKTLKCGRDIDEKWAYNFSDLFYMVFYFYVKFSSNAWESTEDYIWFFAALRRVINHFEKVHNENAAYGIKSVVVAVTFNKSKYRCKHLNTMLACINVPKNLSEIMLFCYQLFSNCLFIFTFVKVSYIMLMILNCLGRQFM